MSAELSKIEHNQKLKAQEKGIGKITLFVFGTLLIIILYSGYCIIPFYYSYYELQNQMTAAVRVASTEDNNEIRKKLVYHIKKLEIPVDPSELVISRSGNRISISLPYQEIFYIKFKDKYYDLHTFNFIAHAEGEY